MTCNFMRGTDRMQASNNDRYGFHSCLFIAAWTAQKKKNIAIVSKDKRLCKCFFFFFFFCGNYSLKIGCFQGRL